MRKITEKVALVAEIVITCVFVIMCVLWLTNVIPQRQNWRDDTLTIVLFAVLVMIYLGLAIYLILAAFSDASSIKKLLLTCDSDSATYASVKVVRRSVNSCAQSLGDIKVKRIAVRLDDKNGYRLRLYVHISGSNTVEPTEKLKVLVADYFKNVFQLTFNTIEFRIVKLKTDYKPNADSENQTDETPENATESDSETSQNDAEIIETDAEVSDAN